MMHRIADIDWSNCIPLGMGGYAVVYRVTPGLVAKVGHIEPAEVEAQRYFAGQGLTLPVLEYRAACSVPRQIDRGVCPVHGLRREILPPAAGYSCTCGTDQAILLMPEADARPVDPDSAEYQAFIMGFSRDCEQQLGLYWDARPANVARYQGRLVALDFGEDGGEV